MRAAGQGDWHRPSQALAGIAARALAPASLARGPLVAAGAAAVLQLGGLAAAMTGMSATGLALASVGALATALARTLWRMRSELLGEGLSAAALARLDGAVDVLTAAVLLFALSPTGTIAPLAMLGPVLIGLARLTVRSSTLAVLADRAVLSGALAFTTVFGLLPHGTALFALVLIGRLLLPSRSDLE